MLIDRLSLPAEVRERLDLGEQSRPGVSCVAVRKNTLVEERFQPLEVRAAEDGTFGILGYATVYDVAYDVAGGIERGGWSETIQRNSAAKSLAEQDDVQLLLDHTGTPMARTRTGTLTLTEDGTGLLADAPKLNVARTDVANMRHAMLDGDLDKMSFAFRVVRQEWDETYENRTITEVQLFDVSVVGSPANPYTSVVPRNEADDETVETGGLPLSLARAHAERLALRR